MLDNILLEGGLASRLPKGEEIMKKVVTFVLAGFLVGSTQFSVQASTISYADQIVSMQPGVTAEELAEQVEELVLSTGMSEEEIYEAMYKEIENQNEMAALEAKQLSEEYEDYSASEDAEIQGGGGSALYIVGPSSRGDFYYTPSATAYVNHGHVGLYYSSNVIVESIYPSGVRSISANVRKVDKGAVVKSISTTLNNKNNATSWAYSQIGQPYSLNFANNRNTGHNGAKNCSKLIWSAFKLNGNLDLDVDKGFGVYPRDVRDAPQTQLKRKI